MKFLLIGVLFNATANLFLKAASNASKGQPAYFDVLPAYSLHPYFILGIACFVGSVAFYTKALDAIQLSIAYPVMTSLSFVIVVLVSIPMFQEKMSFLQAGGALFVIAGIVLLAKG